MERKCFKGGFVPIWRCKNCEYTKGVTSPTRDEVIVPEDLREIYEAEGSCLNARMARQLIERIARAESALAEAKSGWDSAIADLRSAAEICRGVEAQLASLKDRIAGYGAAITARYGAEEFGDLSESALQDAMEVKNLRAQVARLTGPVSDEEIAYLWGKRTEWETGGALCDYGAYRPVIGLFIAARATPPPQAADQSLPGSAVEADAQE
jgi:hypothetical protein